MTIEARVCMLMADVLDVEPERISLDADREALPEWDSLAHLRLITALEEEFGVRPSMSQIGEIHSVRDLVALAEGG